jgi:hypothetical protein
VLLGLNAAVKERPGVVVVSAVDLDAAQQAQRVVTVS